MPIVDVDDGDSERDNPPRREYAYGGNKIIAERQDPYGFWYVHMERGVLPQALKGAWTTVDRVEAAVTKYIEQKSKEKPAVA